MTCATTSHNSESGTFRGLLQSLNGLQPAHVCRNAYCRVSGLACKREAHGRNHPKVVYTTTAQPIFRGFRFYAHGGFSAAADLVPNETTTAAGINS